MTAITGNTYPVRDRLKAIGGRWDAAAKAWMVPDSVAGQARAIVAGVAAPVAGKINLDVGGIAARRHAPSKCRCCGHVERRDARGYVVGDRILRSGECQSCREERKGGY